MQEQYPQNIADDKMINFELCEKGPCLASMPKGKKFLKILYKELMTIKPQFGKLTVKSQTPGESKSLPATSCTALKSFQKANVTGF